ncbi:MAG TPA: ABC transporter ATP-binding protein [Baekduia sp.]|uniref:ABC transporter ATP-binding protein n=1 Tax=Baekduia sp. TaxID=2600305 RepID=UPI002D76760E|nr:ABC transporter ATP-binding protein [Baekduia sp.]HET6509100.1 ABC transporter ATP-binding protein [Baekduia sp.]
MTAPALELRRLTVDLPTREGLRRVVRDVSLRIDAGEAVGLVGESGSGKSMTARSAMRLLPAGAVVGGTIAAFGDAVQDMSAQRLRELRREDVAMVFQDPRAHVNPVRTVGDFLTEGLRYAGAGNAEALRRAEGLLAEVLIADPGRVLRRYPHQLSGGMLQRVMIASALATSPRLLLADEPTTALDVTTQAEIAAILDRLRRERGLAMLFITHDLDLAAAICDRTAVMYAGELVEVQRSRSLHHEPRHPYTSGLIASRPSVSATAERLPMLSGRSIGAWEVEGGCGFSDRCRHAQDACRVEPQSLRAVNQGEVACRRAEEIQHDLHSRIEATVD